MDASGIPSHLCTKRPSFAPRAEPVRKDNYLRSLALLLIRRTVIETSGRLGILRCWKSGLYAIMAISTAYSE